MNEIKTIKDLETFIHKQGKENPSVSPKIDTAVGINDQWESQSDSEKPFIQIFALILNPEEVVSEKFEIKGFWFDLSGNRVDRPVRYLKQLECK